MSSGELVRRHALRQSIELLYERLQHGQLREDDTIDVNAVQSPDLGGFAARLYHDRAEFETHFAAFMAPFAIFRAFSGNTIVLDVGAHWGYSALAMRHQGCAARIVSVEAMPFNVPALQRLAEIDGANYGYLNLAATDRPTELTFFVPVVNKQAAGGLASTGATLAPEFAEMLAARAEHFPAPVDGIPDDVRIATLRVRGATLDSIAESLDVPDRRLVAIKMDVEGHEARALAGASRVLRSEKPLLMVEGGSRFLPVVEVITAHGYVSAAMVDGQLRAHDGVVRAGDGFWVHPDHVGWYRQLGIHA